MENICVSIFMLTYNQEKFIAQAIEGILMQETNFRYQLVIGEDCSTDRTRTICTTYAQKYPEKIKLLLSEKNLGIGANYVRTYRECIGKYVAICDGDDYWIDRRKLQKQVEILEKHPEYKIVYTNNYSLFPSGERMGPKNDGRPVTTSLEDLVLGNYIPSVTVLFKNKALTREMEKWIPEFPFGDWPTYLLILSDGGKIFYINEPTAVYRKGGTSTFLRKKKSRAGEVNLTILQYLKKEKPFQENQKVLKKGILKSKAGLMASYNKERRFFNSMKLLIGLCGEKKRISFLRLYLYSLKRTIEMNGKYGLIFKSK